MPTYPASAQERRKKALTGQPGLIANAQKKRQVTRAQAKAPGGAGRRAAPTRRPTQPGDVTPGTATSPKAGAPAGKSATPPIAAPPADKLAGIQDVLSEKLAGIGGVQPSNAPPPSEARRHGLGAGPVSPPKPGSRSLN